MTTIQTTRLSTKMFVRVLAAALAVSGAGFATAQVPVMPTEYVVVARQDLQQVVAPVALYPDAMLAQTLVASTYPQDVVSAAQWLRDGGDPTWTDFQNWDDSVKGLTHYPEALYLLADNSDWMNQLGAAFINQQADVMAAVQDVRNRARLNGVLASNSYQNVVVDQQAVQIIPANPQVMYVPVYQPQMVLMERPAFIDPASVISFGIGVQVGAWLHHDCDWNDNAVYVGNWGSDRPWWHDRNDFRRDGDRGGYSHNRPGYFASERNVTNINHVTNINNPARWERDARRPAPRPEVRSQARPLAMPQRSVATAPTMPGRLAPSVNERLTAVNRPTPAARPNFETPTVRPTRPTTPAPSNVRPTGNLTPWRENTPAVRPTPTPTVPTVRPTPAPVVRPTPTPVVRPTPVATVPTVRPTPTPSVRPTPTPTVRPTPTPTVRPTPTPTVRPTPTPTVPTVRPTPTPTVRPTPTVPTVRPTPTPTVRPTPAPVVRPTPAPSVPAVRPTPAPAVRPTPAPSAPTVRPTPANPSTPPTARPGTPTGRPTAPGTDTNTRDGATNSPRGR